MSAALALDTTAFVPEPIINASDRLERFACLHRDAETAFALWVSASRPDDDANAAWDRYEKASTANDTLLGDFISIIGPAARRIGRGERPGMFRARLDNDLLRAGDKDGGTCLNLKASYSADDYELAHSAAYLLVNPPLLDDPRDNGGEITLKDAETSSLDDLIGDTCLPSLGQLAIVGPWGAGKTHVGLHFVHKVAREVDATTGLPLRSETFLGKSVGSGSVIYAPSEGGPGLRKRLKALDCRYGRSPNIYVTRKICDLSNLAASVEFFRSAARALAARGCPPVRLIVVDVLLATFGAGMDENSNTDMNRILQNLRRVGRILNCAQLAVHRTGKGAQDEGRGASSFGGNLDMQVNVRRVDGTNFVTVRKLKERALPPKPFPFHLANDVLEEGTGDVPESAQSRALPGVLYAHKVHANSINGRMLSLSEVDPDYKATYYAKSKPGTASGSTSRDRKAAEAAGWIEVMWTGAPGKEKAAGVKPKNEPPVLETGDAEDSAFALDTTTAAPRSPN